MDLFPSSGYISLSHISSLTYAVNCCLNRSAGYFASTIDVVSGLPTIPLYRLAMPNPDDVRALWMEVMGYKLMFTMWTSVYGTKWKLTSEILTRKKIHSTKHILSLNFNGRLELPGQGSPLLHLFCIWLSYLIYSTQETICRKKQVILLCFTVGSTITEKNWTTSYVLTFLLFFLDEACVLKHL